MKKTYMKPAIASKKIEMSQIICASAKFSSGSIPAENADAKEFFDFLLDE
jgi:hypothetical protein